jgi:hypothetical protein
MPKPAGISSLRRFGPLLLAVLAFLVFRAVTADDAAEDITTGQCVTADPTRDVRTVDCSDPSALGRVVFVQRESFTDDSSVRRTCADHGSTRAFTSAVSQGGTGTVVCVVPIK